MLLHLRLFLTIGEVSMRFIVLCSLLFVLFLSCASTDKTDTVAVETVDAITSPENSQTEIIQKSDQEITILVDNPTNFNVYFDGSQLVRKQSSARVNLLIEDATLTSGFDILYEVSLSNTVSIFCKGDHRTIREDQTSFTVTEPKLTESYGTYIILRNGVNNAISFYTGGEVNPSWEQRGSPIMGDNLSRTDKREFSPAETVVFKIDRSLPQGSLHIRDNRRNIPLILPSDVQGNYAYTFDYTANGATLTDARPLHRIGESMWRRTIESTGRPFFAENTNRTITAISADTFGVLDSNGTIIESNSLKGNRSITSMNRMSENAYLTAGFEQNGIFYSSVLEKRSRDGIVIWKASASLRNDSEYAALLSIVQKENDVWLAGGMAESHNNAMNGFYQPYLKEICDRGNSVEVAWEMGPDDFPDEWEKIRCMTYDEKNKRYIIVGDLFSSSGEDKKSFMAFISEDGKLLDSFIIDNTTFNQVLCDADGNVYLTGEEVVQNQAYAVIRKFDSSGNPLQFVTRRLSANSYYQTALFDEDTGFLVLGGTSGAETASGNKGRPFVQAIDITNGAEVWFEELSSIASGLNLVTGLQKAIDYGFLVSLSGIHDNFSPPYFIARLNSQGKYNY
jgi:hypothetical protein